MTWNRRYQVKSYLRSALWVIPFVSVPLEQVAWVLARTLDTRVLVGLRPACVDSAQSGD